MLNKKDLHDLIETTLLDIKLTGAVVEKDYYVNNKASSGIPLQVGIWI